MILIDWEAYILPPAVHFEFSYTADCTSASSHGTFMVGKELKINRKEEEIRRKEEVRQKDEEVPGGGCSKTEPEGGHPNGSTGSPTELGGRLPIELGGGRPTTAEGWKGNGESIVNWYILIRFALQMTERAIFGLLR